MGPWERSQTERKMCSALVEVAEQAGTKYITAGQCWYSIPVDKLLVWRALIFLVWHFVMWRSGSDKQSRSDAQSSSCFRIGRGCKAEHLLTYSASHQPR